MAVRVIFVTVGTRQDGHAEMDIEAFQGFTYGFQHVRGMLTFQKYALSSPVYPSRLWYAPKLLSLPGVKRPQREADNSPQPSARIQYECCLTALSVDKTV